MCTLEELRVQNKLEHGELHTAVLLLQKDVKAAISFSRTIKWVAGVIATIAVGLLGVLAVFSILTYTSAERRRDSEIASYKAVNDLSDSISDHWAKTNYIYRMEIRPQKIWIQSMYDSIIVPTEERSKATEARSKKNARLLLKNGLI